MSVSVSIYARWLLSDDELRAVFSPAKLRDATLMVDSVVQQTRLARLVASDRILSRL